MNSEVKKRSRLLQMQIYLSENNGLNEKSRIFFIPQIMSKDVPSNASPEYKFLDDIFQNFNMLDSVVDSYNQVYDKLKDIISKFKLQYLYNTAQADYTDEQLVINVNLSDPTIIKPGADGLPLTDTEAVARRKDFMCRYKFQLEYIITLKMNKRKQKGIENFIDNKSVELNIEKEEFNYQNQIKMLEGGFDQFNLEFEKSQSISIKAGFLEFELPVMVGSVMDPMTTMTARQIYDLGCDTKKVPGDIVLAGIAYQISNTLSYPYNLPIVAEPTLPGQVIRVDYLCQHDVEYGNTHQNIFLLIEQQIKKEKAKNIQSGTIQDIVFNFKQRHDVNFHDGDNYIPISLLFRAYGCKTDRKVLEYCNQQNERSATLFFISIFQDGPEHLKYMKDRRKFSQLEALFQIGQIISKNPIAQNYYDVFTLTNIALSGLSKYVYKIELGQESAYCQTLGEICNGIYKALINPQFLTDRDALYNKRVVPIGQQIVAELRTKMGEMFKNSVRFIVDTLKQKNFEEIKQTTDVVQRVLISAAAEFSKDITTSIKKSFTSTQNADQKIMKAMNECRSAFFDVSQKREIVIKRPSTGAKTSYAQRKAHRSFFGFICPISTPDSGDNVGRYMSPTIYSYVSIPQDSEKVWNYLKKHKYFETSLNQWKRYMAVKINYMTKGFVEEPHYKELYDDLMNWRIDNAFKKGDVNHITTDADQLFISIYYNITHNEINIMTDSGRLMIPIFQKFPIGNFVEGLESGEIMFICSTMAQNFIVDEYSLRGRDERIKWFFGPSGCIGTIMAMNPLFNHNKMERSMMSFSQMKSCQTQAMTNYANYYIKNLFVMNENQRPVVHTPFEKNLFSGTPHTQMVYMGIMPYTDNQEDAVILCEDFIARYGFATTSYKTYTAQQQSQSERFDMPQQIAKQYNYSKIDSTKFQITKMGTNIKPKDVLISKVKIVENGPTIDQSVVYDITQHGEYSCISSINKYSYDPIANLKVERISFGRMPSVGDKIASRNCQKATVGATRKGWEMPMTSDGIVLNMIQNSDAIIRRETYSQLLELFIGKYALQQGMLDIELSIDQEIEFYDKLHEVKLDKVLLPFDNGFFQNPEIVSGMMSYTIQRHVVDEKIRFRTDEGKIDAISKQSAPGKRVGGGLRIGDMERHSLTAAGISNILRNFFGRLSSNVQYDICGKCGTTNIQYRCLMCDVLPNNAVIRHGDSYNAILLSHIFHSCGCSQTFLK